ncbi:hypothetical protein KY359_05685 [Candidatus Woesearchaeota archaeon]|nr:hypothetical protein [Candidatus Woesearchaeota archaeon]
MIEDENSDALHSFTARFTDMRLLHVEKIGRQYFQVLPELKELMDKTRKNLRREPFSAGLFLGELKGKVFRPSVVLIDLIGRASEHWVMVDEKAEWLFLCGRDIFAKSVVKTTVTSGLAIVRSRKGEVLGYGKVTGKLKDGDKVFLRNMLDRGDFLRREMGKKRGKGKH